MSDSPKRTVAIGSSGCRDVVELAEDHEKKIKWGKRAITLFAVSIPLMAVEAFTNNLIYSAVVAVILLATLCSMSYAAYLQRKINENREGGDSDE